MKFNDVMALRQSVRSFSDQEVSREDLERIVSAASRAPVGKHNYGGYQITVITSKNALSKMVETYKKVSGKNKNPIFNAPAFILVSANSSAFEKLKWQDAGCIVDTMHLEATDMGLGSCYIYGMVRDLANEPDWKVLVNLPEDCQPLSGLAVGHAAREIKPRKAQNLFKVNYAG